MQLEIYSLTALKDQISVSLEAICDSYSSLLWDIEFYQCGCFEVYIAASPQNVSIFQRGRIVARSDDAQHFGIIESLQLETDAEKGDYLTVTGRFLACLLERRIIYPTITANGSYEDIVRKVLSRNVISAGIRNLPGFPWVRFPVTAGRKPHECRSAMTTFWNGCTAFVKPSAVRQMCGWMETH